MLDALVDSHVSPASPAPRRRWLVSVIMPTNDPHRPRLIKAAETALNAAEYRAPLLHESAAPLNVIATFEAGLHLAVAGPEIGLFGAKQLADRVFQGIHGHRSIVSD